MPWTTEASSPSCGFTTGDPWLPLPPGWGDRSVAAQREDPSSMLSLYRDAVAARRASAPLRTGSFSWLASDDHVLAFERTTPGGRVSVAVNAGDEVVVVRLSGAGELLLASGHGVRMADRSSLHLPPDTAAWVEERSAG
jgi:alpha-glucosidase